MDGVAEAGSEERLKREGIYVYIPPIHFVVSRNEHNVVKHLYCTKASYQNKTKQNEDIFSKLCYLDTYDNKLLEILLNVGVQWYIGKWAENGWSKLSLAFKCCGTFTFYQENRAGVAGVLFPRCTA